MIIKMYGGIKQLIVNFMEIKKKKGINSNNKPTSKKLVRRKRSEDQVLMFC